VWAIDHDDGSQFFNDTSNVLVWGGCKNYRGHSKSCDHNTILYPGDRAHSSGGRKVGALFFCDLYLQHLLEATPHPPLMLCVYIRRSRCVCSSAAHAVCVQCQTDDNGIFADQYYHGNKCFEHGGLFYSFSKCTQTNVNSTTYQTANNTFFVNSSASESWGAPCGAKDFATWQSWGQDMGSKIVESPDISGIIDIAKQTLA
jgi:hypothetical protein